MVAFNGKVYTFKVPVPTVYLQSSALQMQSPYLPTIILEPGPALSLSLPGAERTVKPPGGTIRHDKQGGESSKRIFKETRLPRHPHPPAPETRHDV